jgi:hypothetical protein
MFSYKNARLENIDVILKTFINTTRPRSDVMGNSQRELRPPNACGIYISFQRRAFIPGIYIYYIFSTKTAVALTQ